MFLAPPSLLRSDGCDLCGQQTFQPVANRDRRGQPLQTDICRTCGLITHAIIPTEDELVAFYTNQYRMNYHGESSPAPHRVIRDWNRGRGLVRLLAPLIDQKDRIIEVGCGMGATVKQLGDAGFRAEGIDPGKSFGRFGIERLRAPIRSGRLADLAPIPTYDLVLLVHVLEHLRSPTASLTHLQHVLQPGGRIFIEVPNAGAPHAAPGRMFHFAHIYNFTSDTLTMLIQKAGFRICQWFSSPKSKNLQVMVEHDSTVQWQLHGQSYDRIVATLTRYNHISYHLRQSYLKQRLTSLLRYPCDHLMAPWRLERILSRCA